jgi:S-adenosylmethionine/arginine decarboxylase-like enzyme
MESLGYGAHLIVDGFGATAPLGDEGWNKEAAAHLLAQLGEHGPPTLVSYWFEDGVSVGLALPESHLTLHTFAERRTVSLSLFSPQLLAIEKVLGAFRERFGVGRLESHLGSRGVALPQEEARAVPYLLGERNYTDVRLDDSLLVL